MRKKFAKDRFLQISKIIIQEYVIWILTMGPQWGEVVNNHKIGCSVGINWMLTDDLFPQPVQLLFNGFTYKIPWWQGWRLAMGSRIGISLTKGGQATNRTDVQFAQSSWQPWTLAYMHGKSLQSCPALCDPMDCSLPGSSVHGILQARILEWVAISFSRAPSWPRDQNRISYISSTGSRFFTTSTTWTLELVSDLKGSSQLLGQIDYKGLRDGGRNLSH